MYVHMRNKLHAGREPPVGPRIPAKGFKLAVPTGKSHVGNR